MKKMGIFYAPAKGSTEKVAKLVADKFGDSAELHLLEENTETSVLDNYDNIIFGISTVGRDHWDSHYGKIGWDYFLAKLDHYNFEGKTVAIFGLGNHIMYKDNFLDALGHLAPKIFENNGKLVGQVAVDKYEDFEDIDSFGVLDGNFPGLPIDEDNLSDETGNRVDEWVNEIKPLFA